MKRIKYLGLSLVVVCALSVTASASAHMYDATLSGAIKGTAKAPQVFTTAAGKVECSTLSVTSGTTALLLLIEHVTVQYGGCKAFGLAATVSPALYTFSADEELVTVDKGITIKAVGCLVTVPAKQDLKKIVYKNSGSEIVLEPNVSGITSEGSGAACTYASENKGTYTGNSSISVAGGSIKWT
jgi:hypothetical protein